MNALGARCLVGQIIVDLVERQKAATFAQIQKRFEARVQLVHPKSSPTHETMDLDVLRLACLAAGQESLVLQLYRTMRVRVGVLVDLVEQSFQVLEPSLPLSFIEHDQHFFEPLPPGNWTQIFGKMPRIGRAQGRLRDQARRQGADCRIVEPNHEIGITGRLALVLKVIARLEHRAERRVPQGGYRQSRNQPGDCFRLAQGDLDQLQIVAIERARSCRIGGDPGGAAEGAHVRLGGTNRRPGASGSGRPGAAAETVHAAAAGAMRFSDFE